MCCVPRLAAWMYLCNTFCRLPLLVVALTPLSRSDGYLEELSTVAYSVAMWRDSNNYAIWYASGNIDRMTSVTRTWTEAERIVTEYLWRQYFGQNCTLAMWMVIRWSHQWLSSEILQSLHHHSLQIRIWRVIDPTTWSRDPSILDTGVIRDGSTGILESSGGCDVVK